MLKHQMLQGKIGQSAYRGGGRRGARPFRGGGRSHYGYHGPRPDGSAPPYRGRGRGRGGGRHFPSHGAISATPNSVLAPASVPGQAPVTVPAEVPSAPSWPPPRMAWCELCRVDCNTMEILEQHKNGKRHKKNLQIHEELQNLNKLITEQQNVQMPSSEFKAEVIQPEKVEGSEEKQPPQESLPSQTVTDKRNETEQQKDKVDKSEVSMVVLPEESKRKSREHFEARGRGFKRNMRGARGGKYMRTNEGSRRPFEPPKPKEVIPFICELCNVKCESQVVFDSHLAGKKHLGNLKRFHGHRALYGEVGLQALYPPNFNAPSSSYVPHAEQGVNDPQVLLAQLLTYVLSQTQTPGLVGATVPGLAATQVPAPASVPSLETEHHRNSQAGGSQAISESGNKNAVTVEAKSQQQLITAEFEAPSTVRTDTNEEDGTSECEAKDASLPQDNSVIATSKNTDLGAGQVLSATAMDKAVPMPECEVASTDQVVQPGPGNDTEDPELLNEELS